MSQVTIYLEEDTLAAAKAAASRAKMSLSKWFAQFADAEKQKPKQSWAEFFAEIDKNKDVWKDFPTLEEIRANEVPDRPLEQW